MANLKQFVKDYSVQIIIGIGIVILTLVMATAQQKEAEGVGKTCCQKICKENGLVCYSSSMDYVKCYSPKNGTGYQEIVDFAIYDRKVVCLGLL